MKFSRITVVILLLFALISCQNGLGKKHDAEPKKQTVPSTEYQKIEKSLPKLNRQKPIKQPVDKELKKKKSRAMDTLKPVTAIP